MAARDAGGSPAKRMTAAGVLTAPALFFLEARLSPGFSVGDQLMAQLGVSVNPANNLSLGVLTRTSSVLLFAGVGSYCAYRIGCRLLGKNFTWTLLDAVKCDLVADSRLFHPAAEGFYTVRLGEDDLHELKRFLLDSHAFSTTDNFDEEEEDARCSVTGRNYTLISSSADGETLRLVHTNPLKRIKRQSPRCNTGLSSLASTSQMQSPLLSSLETSDGCGSIRGRTIMCRLGAERDEDTLSDVSDISSASRHRRSHRCTSSAVSDTPLHFRQRSLSMSTSEAGDEAERGSLASASLKLLWKCEQDWDDEFASNDMLVFKRSDSPTPSGISHLSAFKNLQIMFNRDPGEDSNELYRSDTAAGPSSPTPSDVFTNLRIPESGSIADGDRTRTDISRYFDSNPSYMYRSVIVERSDLTPSDIRSLCSNASARSCFSAIKKGREKTATASPSHGQLLHLQWNSIYNCFQALGADQISPQNQQREGEA